jgi:hypothetical protein
VLPQEKRKKKLRNNKMISKTSVSILLSEFTLLKIRSVILFFFYYLLLSNYFLRIEIRSLEISTRARDGIFHLKVHFSKPPVNSFSKNVMI